MSHLTSCIAADHGQQQQPRSRSRSTSATRPTDEPVGFPENNGHIVPPAPRRRATSNLTVPVSVSDALPDMLSGNIAESYYDHGPDGNSSTESTRELQPEDLTDPVGDRLRVDLQFFFMDPIRKWSIRRQIPWKLIVQIMKIILVTTQLSLFGSMRVTHVNYLEETKTVFRHLFLKNWDTTRDIRAYPPPNGPFAVYTYTDVYSSLNFTIYAFNAINTTAIGSFDFHYINDVPKPATFCISEYAEGKVTPRNATYTFNTSIVRRCLVIPLNFSLLNTTIQNYLAEMRESIDFDRLSRAELMMDIKTIHLKNLQPYDTPDCFLMKIAVFFDNSAHSGQLVMGIDFALSYISKCHGEISYAKDVTRTKVLLDVLDVIVIFVCISSFILCTRALVRGQQLMRKTKLYFRSERKRHLSIAGQLAFLNLWWVAIIVNDVLIVLGTIFKLSIEFRDFKEDLFTATAILLGTGDLLVWCGILRYMGFFAHYNVMILTLKKAFPNVLRFMLCAALVYFGFAFCGWVILGPYHYKFRSFMATSECLFSLVNGDDMYATFDTTSAENTTIWWFARVYIYLFVALFIYFILSLFIAIIMDAYEVVKEVYEQKDGKSDLLTFLLEPTPTIPSAPGLGISDPSDPLYVSVSSQELGDYGGGRRGFLGFLYRCCRPAVDTSPVGQPAYDALGGE